MKNIFFFNPFKNKPWFLHISSTSLENTVGKGEIARKRNFSFSLSVFYPFGEVDAIIIEVEIVFCKCFQFGRV